MDNETMEGDIQDTSNRAFDDDEETSADQLTCTVCSKLFSTADGGSKYLKRCQLCVAALAKRMEGDKSASSAGVEETTNLQSISDLPATVAGECTTQQATGANTTETEPFIPSTIEDVNDAVLLTLATPPLLNRDTILMCKLHGRNETYRYLHDPVNRGTSRKLFTRTSCDIPLLYGYDLYGICMTHRSNAIICPLFVTLRGTAPTETRQFVLISIGETLCNKPRYDGLLVDFKDNSAFWYRNIINSIEIFHFDKPFDYLEAHR
jgi:hypothetical protein